MQFRQASITDQPGVVPNSSFPSPPLSFQNHGASSLSAPHFAGSIAESHPRGTGQIQDAHGSGQQEEGDSPSMDISPLGGIPPNNMPLSPPQSPPTAQFTHRNLQQRALRAEDQMRQAQGNARQAAYQVISNERQGLVQAAQQFAQVTENNADQRVHTVENQAQAFLSQQRDALTNEFQGALLTGQHATLSQAEQAIHATEQGRERDRQAMEQYIVHIEEQAGSALQNQEQGLAQHFDSELHQARIELQAITDAQQGQVQAAQDALAARTTQAELADQQAYAQIEQLTLAWHASEAKNHSQEQQLQSTGHCQPGSAT